MQTSSSYAMNDSKVATEQMKCYFKAYPLNKGEKENKSNNYIIL